MNLRFILPSITFQALSTVAPVPLFFIRPREFCVTVGEIKVVVMPYQVFHCTKSWSGGIKSVTFVLQAKRHRNRSKACILWPGNGTITSSTIKSQTLTQVKPAKKTNNQPTEQPPSNQLQQTKQLTNNFNRPNNLSNQPTSQSIN